MGSSRKSRPSDRVSTELVSRVAGNIKDIVRSGDRLAVGLSGGVDSVVLLDILGRLAGRQRFRLSAIHVNHQLSPNAPRWAAFCRKLCRARGMPLRIVAVTVQRGDSVEAAARAARYQAFSRLGADYVVLAHHQDDQAETLLLQLLRGAGVRGLAAMPLVRIQEPGFRIQRKQPRHGKQQLNPECRIPNPAFLRPLLDVPRSEIVRYARARSLAWIEDESNADIHFSRNFLRREVLPVIAQRFPAYGTTLGRAGRHLAEASQLLDELARADGARYCGKGVLQVAGLRRLSRARAKNLLRWFLGNHGLLMPNADRLEEALRQALAARTDARVGIDLGNWELRRFAGALQLVPKSPVPPASFSRVWRGEGRLALPELGGVLTMRKRRGTGIDAAKLKAGAVTVRVRQGAERLQPAAERPRRSLKNLLQEAGVPPWQRERMPLLYCGDALVWVPEIGIACEFQAKAGEASIMPAWEAR